MTLELIEELKELVVLKQERKNPHAGRLGKVGGSLKKGQTHGVIEKPQPIIREPQQIQTANGPVESHATGTPQQMDQLQQQLAAKGAVGYEKVPDPQDPSKVHLVKNTAPEPTTPWQGIKRVWALDPDSGSGQYVEMESHGSGGYQQMEDAASALGRQEYGNYDLAHGADGLWHVVKKGAKLDPTLDPSTKPPDLSGIDKYMHFTSEDNNYNYESSGNGDATQQVIQDLVDSTKVKDEDEATEAAYGLLIEWANEAENPEDSVIGMTQARIAAAKAFGLKISDHEQWRMDGIKNETFKGGGGAFNTSSNWDSNIAIRTKLLKTMYKNTQKDLKDHGINNVTLYRGVMLKDDIQGNQAKFEPSSLESWTADKTWADHFANGGETGEQGSTYGFTMKVTVPRSRILSTARTGMGTSYQQEVVLLGKKEGEDPMDQAEIVARYRNTPTRARGVAIRMAGQE